MSATTTTAAKMTGEETYGKAIRLAANGDQEQKVIAVGLMGADQALKDIACVCGIRRYLVAIAEAPIPADLMNRRQDILKELQKLRATIAKAQVEEAALKAQAEKERDALGRSRQFVSGVIHAGIVNPIVAKALAAEIKAAGIAVSNEALAEQDELVKQDCAECE